MRVSIVICTYNRAHGLEDTLECLRYQNYHDFEVVVVNGPSTDDTEQVLDKWRDRVRVDNCPLPNLSVSRNIGIRAASGEIVAFIDDDALPDFDWLQQALPSFADEEVAGVGGIVFDHTGMALQYKYSAANRFAEVAVRHDRPYDDQCAPGSFQFPYLQGTNALFRRAALLQIGGFDETFDYYLDETDVCVRLIDAGYTLRQLDNAAVHHKFLPSSVRDHQRVITNWFPIMKNQVYFSYRHALRPFTEYDIHEHSQAFLQSRIEDARFHETAGRLPKDAHFRAAVKCAEAFRVGMELGWARRDLRLGPVHWEAPRFKPFPIIDSSHRRKITMVTTGYTPNVTGGIARFFSDLAPALARRGHEVRVVTLAIGSAAVDLEEGVWVHRIDSPPAGQDGVAPDALPHINDFATAAALEIERIGSWSSHDVVYGPLWDVEILGALQRTGLPIAVQVATPLAVAAEMAGHMDDPESAAVMARLMALETQVLEQADLFHANSSAVADTIRHHYGDKIDPARWGIVHLGLVDNKLELAVAPRRTTVFFVGRFETRKGIDTYLAAIERLAPLHPEVDFIAAGEDRPLAPGLPPFGESWRAAHEHDPWINRVRFAGTVSDELLHELYHGSDLVVLPSRYESFGLVMVEAMIHGKALVSCDTSGIRDVVRNGIDGVLVEPGNVDALAGAMHDLLIDEAARNRLGVSARQRFVDAFHIDRFAERFERFLDRLALRDATDRIRSDEDVRLSRAATGQMSAVLEAEQHVEFQTDGLSRSRISMTAQVPSIVEIADGSLHEMSLDPGQVCRVDVGGSAGSVGVRVLNGEVHVHGIIDVRADES